MRIDYPIYSRRLYYDYRLQRLIRTTDILSDNSTTVAYAYDDGVTSAQYYCDPFGRRLWKEVDGVRTYFLYSNEGLVGEFDSTDSQLKSYGW